MDANIRYITEISAQDLRELAALTHLEEGDGIVIQRNGDSIKIGIDRTKLIALLSTV